MQKKLIALAIAAAFSAPAFADTNVYGLVDAGYGSASNTNAGVKTTESGTAFSQHHTSKVGVKSTEDLSGGMKAIFQLEMGLSSNPFADTQWQSGTAIAVGKGFAPNTTIGVDRVLTAGLDFGQGTTLTAGKMSTPLRNIVYTNGATFGDNLIGNLVTMDSSLIARATAISAAHNFGVVTGSLTLLNNTTQRDGTTDVKHDNGFEATAVYKQDALSVAGGYRSTKNNSLTAIGTANPASNEVTTKDLILAANYDLGMAQLYGQFANVKVDQSAVTTTSKKTYETLGVNVPFTPTLAGYVELSTGKNDMGGGVDPKMNAYGVGVKYDLSKATFAYGHFGSAKQDQKLTSAESKVEQVAFGLVHSF
jgi:predicted porin